MYIDDIIDQRVLDEIHQRIDKLDLDILTSIHELESLVRDRPFSIFPSMDYTGRPDFIVQALNQGGLLLLLMEILQSLLHQSIYYCKLNHPRTLTLVMLMYL